MALEVTRELKEEFEKFCKDEFPNKIYKSNKYDSKKNWFYVQAGNNYKDFIHYEFNGEYIYFHIEIRKTNVAEVFASYIENNQNLLKKINNKTDYQKATFIFNKQINSEEDLWNSFLEIRDKIESLIYSFETGEVN